jgi:hypothetical protein
LRSHDRTNSAQQRHLEAHDRTNLDQQNQINALRGKIITTEAQDGE